MIPDIVDPETGEVLNDGYSGFIMPIAPRTAIEERAETDSLESLQQRRRDLIKRNDRLIAWYDSFGLYPDRRKQAVETEKVRIDLDLTEKGLKPTEKRIDAMAHACDNYKKFLDTCEREKIAFLYVKNELTEIEEKIRARDQGIGEHIKSMGLQR